MPPTSYPARPVIQRDAPISVVTWDENPPFPTTPSSARTVRLHLLRRDASSPVSRHQHHNHPQEHMRAAILPDVGTSIKKGSVDKSNPIQSKPSARRGHMVHDSAQLHNGDSRHATARVSVKVTQMVRKGRSLINDIRGVVSTHTSTGACENADYQRRKK